MTHTPTPETTCRCGEVAPMNCPLHGDEANSRTADAFQNVIDALGARPGGPLRKVPNEAGESAPPANAERGL